MKQTKEKILEAAFVLMLKNGINGVSTSDIANALGVARSLPYKHFKNKKELVLESFKLFFWDRFIPEKTNSQDSLRQVIEFCEQNLRDIISNSGRDFGAKIDVFSYNALYIEALKHEPKFKRYSIERAVHFRKIVLRAIRRGEIKNVGVEFIMRVNWDILGRAVDVITETSKQKNLENMISDIWKFYALIKK